MEPRDACESDLIGAEMALDAEIHRVTLLLFETRAYLKRLHDTKEAIVRLRFPVRREASADVTAESDSTPPAPTVTPPASEPAPSADPTNASSDQRRAELRDRIVAHLSSYPNATFSVTALVHLFDASRQEILSILDAECDVRRTLERVPSNTTSPPIMLYRFAARTADAAERLAR